MRAKNSLKLASIHEEYDFAKSSLWAVSIHGSLWKVRIDSGDVKHLQLVETPEDFRALSVCVTKEEEIWIKATSCDGECKLFRRNGSRWISSVNVQLKALVKPGWHSDIIVVENGLLHRIEKGEKKEELSFPFNPVDVSNGPKGKLWAVGAPRRFGGFAVWHYCIDRRRWSKLPKPAAATKVEARFDGSAWSLNSHGDLWRIHPEGAGNFEECGADPNCRNCLFSSKTSKAWDLSSDANGVTWFVLGSPFSDRVGVLLSSSDRKFLAIRLPEPVRSICSIAEVV